MRNRNGHFTERKDIEAMISLSKEIYEENGGREELLRAKCNWEHMTRGAVLECWGDPATWPDGENKQ